MQTTRDSKIGLACAGGVVEGAIFEIGALCALEEAIDGLDFTEMDVYVGVSSGALVASFLANGFSATTMSDALVSQAGPQLNFNPNLFFKPAVGEYLRRMGQLPEAARQTLKAFLANPLDATLFGWMTQLGRIVPAGLFNNSYLQHYLHRLFTEVGRSDSFDGLDAQLYVVATNVESARIAVFGRAELAHVPISLAVQASTSLPVLYCPVEIDGHYYIDGVARKTVHASVALDKGTNLLFCINPIVPVDTSQSQRDALSPNGWHGVTDGGLPTVLSQTFRTLVHSRMRTGFRKYAHSYPDADIVLIEPRVDDYSLFFSNIFSFSNRQAVCEHAYLHTRAFLRESADEIAPKLERHGLRLRRDNLADENRTLYGDATRHLSASLNEGVRRASNVLDRLDSLLDGLENVSR